MIINRTVRWLDCWILKLEYANERINQFIEGRKPYCHEATDMSLDIDEVYCAILEHRQHYLSLRWSFCERPLIARSTLDCLDYSVHELALTQEELRLSDSSVSGSVEKLKKLETVLEGVISRLQREQYYYSSPWYERWKSNNGFVGFILEGIHTAIDEKLAWNTATREYFQNWINRLDCERENLCKLRHDMSNASSVLSKMGSSLFSVERELSYVQESFRLPWWRRYKMKSNITKETVACFDDWITKIETLSERAWRLAYRKDETISLDETIEIKIELDGIVRCMLTHLGYFSIPWYRRWLEENLVSPTKKGEILPHIR